MKKYKQIIIPSVNTPKEFKNYSASELSKFAKDYYTNNIQGKSVVNVDLGFRITFSGQGKNKISKGSVVYSKKIAILFIIQDLLRHASYNNFGQPKENDPKNLLGYLNFKCKAKIDNRIEYVRIAVLLYKDGKIFFHHSVNQKK